jgi:hypothetical protein
MEPSFRSIREQLLVLDGTVIDPHGGEGNLVILSCWIRKCQFKFWVMINAYWHGTHTSLRGNPVVNLDAGTSILELEADK